MISKLFAVTLLVAPIAAYGQTYYGQYPYTPGQGIPGMVPTYQPPITYQNFGNMTYGSDGSNAMTLGNQTYMHFPNGGSVTCNRIGFMTTCQ